MCEKERVRAANGVRVVSSVRRVELISRAASCCVMSGGDAGIHILVSTWAGRARPRCLMMAWRGLCGGVWERRQPGGQREACARA